MLKNKILKSYLYNKNIRLVLYLNGFSYYKFLKFLVKKKYNYINTKNYKNKFILTNNKEYNFYDYNLIKIILRLLIKKSKKQWKSLKKKKKKKLSLWKKIKHYKWYRIIKKLPLNGQRTKTNARTIKRIKIKKVL